MPKRKRLIKTQLGKKLNEIKKKWMGKKFGKRREREGK
jgi:hypothetical protein